MGSLKMKILLINLSARPAVYCKLQQTIQTYQPDALILQKVGDKEIYDAKKTFGVSSYSAYKSNSGCMELFSGFKKDPHTTIMSVSSSDQSCRKIVTKVLKDRCGTLFLINLYWPQSSKGFIADTLDNIVNQACGIKTIIAVLFDSNVDKFNELQQYACEKGFRFRSPSGDKSNAFITTPDLIIQNFKRVNVKERTAMIFDVEVKPLSLGIVGQNIE